MPKRKKTQSKRERKQAMQAVEHLPVVTVQSNVVESIREVLLALVRKPDLDAHLGQIARAARQADDLLVVIKAPEAVMRDEHALLGVTATTVPAIATGPETYGASILRQLIPALQDFRKAQNETPEAMVHAITLARRNGMTDVAAELEKKLTGKPLDGARPVSSGILGIDTYLPPTLKPLPKDESGPQPFILGKDPKECDGVYPRTRDGRCHGCGIVGEHPKKGATKKTNKKNGPNGTAIVVHHASKPS
jgi:hypothetical protein